jgi:hypothetical protein
LLGICRGAANLRSDQENGEAGAVFTHGAKRLMLEMFREGMRTTAG